MYWAAHWNWGCSIDLFVQVQYSGIISIPTFQFQCPGTKYCCIRAVLCGLSRDLEYNNVTVTLSSLSLFALSSLSLLQVHAQWSSGGTQWGSVCSDHERESHDHWLQRQTDQGTHTYRLALEQTVTNWRSSVLLSAVWLGGCQCTRSKLECTAG